MNLKNFVFAILISAVSGCAHDSVTPSQSKCESDYMYVYNLHNQAIEAARSGDCEGAASKFTSTVNEMARLSEAEYCNQRYKSSALDGYHRAVHDASILKSKYCPDVSIIIPVKKQ